VQHGVVDKTAPSRKLCRNGASRKAKRKSDEMKYYVVGGEYLDAEHRRLKPGTREQYGPFDDYAAALDKWRERAWATIDDTYCRFTVLSEDEFARQPSAADGGATGRTP